MFHSILVVEIVIIQQNASRAIDLGQNCVQSATTASCNSCKTDSMLLQADIPRSVLQCRVINNSCRLTNQETPQQIQQMENTYVLLQIKRHL